MLLISLMDVDLHHLLYSDNKWYMINDKKCILLLFLTKVK